MLSDINPQNSTMASALSLLKTATFRFFAVAFLAYAGWSVAYEQVLKPRTMLDEMVIDHMVRTTEAAFDVVGWPVGTYPQPTTHRNRVGVAGHAGVQIGEPCDGVELFALADGRVLTSIKPIQQISAALLDGIDEPAVLLPPGASPLYTRP